MEKLAGPTEVSDSGARQPRGGSCFEPYPLSQEQFQRVVRMMYQVAGIHLKEGKQNLVKARLGRRIRTLGLSGFKEYFDLVEKDGTGAELAEMVDLLTTNKTEFFRDPVHFDFLRKYVLEPRAQQRRWRFWSAGCSSGQEAYSLAMLAFDVFGSLEGRDLKILATDVCRPVLQKAMAGYYEDGELEGLPKSYLRRFMVREGAGFRVCPEIRSLVRFARLNLNEPWPLRGPFQAILCRNVMIYFDQTVRQRLLQRFYALLEDGGFLFIGLSESLTGVEHSYRYIRPAVYQKCLQRLSGSHR